MTLNIHVGPDALGRAGEGPRPHLVVRLQAAP